MEEHLTILKKIRDKCVTLMKINLETYRACWHKTTFHRFFLNTDNTDKGLKDLDCAMVFKP